jgi:hypothetical protein
MLRSWSLSRPEEAEVKIASPRLKELISTGYSESSLEICHQLIVFEASVHGLLATWETPQDLICVPVKAQTSVYV